MRSRLSINVVGCHAEGEIGDVIVGGVLPPAGKTMMERMITMERDHDHIRQLLICEPRGSVARHVNLIVPAITPGCAAGAIIMEPTEYPPMSGSNTICVATVLLETGMVPMQEPVTRFKLDMPGGVIEVAAECRDGKCRSVTFRNAPAFAALLDGALEVEGHGTIPLDIAYGGMFFGIVDAKALGFEIRPDEARDLAVLGEKIRKAAREQFEVAHPEFPNVRGVSIVQFAMPFAGTGKVTRNTCIVAPGRSDRSPTGTGTSARMAVLQARGLMGVGDVLIHESIIGSQFVGKILEVNEQKGVTTITPQITGRAWITGQHSYLLDPEDPWQSGYMLSDTWGVTPTLKQ
ncbi:proline racemase family protein [Paracoccus methylovorus]|uniref:Proline racemase family protein n=1 Tax=Paracoccus methylovorus TaxID=2812658 RepID=A0ABX7JMW1_9RHOB|nr:proline racemase family protein [Paracoccus methylovorus]QRZ14999.1 proline racemase family protein [Paracoccus methylovorus]